LILCATNFTSKANRQKTHASPLQKENFKRACQFNQLKPLQLIFDVPTRWNSVYTMCERGVYLRKAIDTYVQQQAFFHLEISQQEWKRVEFLLDILEPFKRCNDRMEGTKRPGIEKVFWVYETLFNEIDRLVEAMDNVIGRDSQWIRELLPAFQAMRAKLTKYYDKTATPFVYGDGMILDPRLKLYLTKQSQWSGGDEGEYSTAGYSAACRKRYCERYEKLPTGLAPSITPTTSQKRPHSAIDDDDFEQMVNSLPADGTTNEYDTYIAAPRVSDKRPLLDIWQTYSATSFPHLGFMARDVFAVPATGAGVEREFSRSGKVETKLRAQLDPVTTAETMMYVDMLKRKNRAIGKAEIVIDGGKGQTETPEDEPPAEWRNDWFKFRKNKKTVL